MTTVDERMIRWHLWHEDALWVAPEALLVGFQHLCGAMTPVRFERAAAVDLADLACSGCGATVQDPQAEAVALYRKVALVSDRAPVLVPPA